MKETRILLASILKPVTDTRMYHKFGLSLAKIPQAAVHVVGFATPLPTNAPHNVFFHPIFSFPRLSPKRFLVSLKFLYLLARVKPQVVIICTPELLVAGLIYKLFSSCSLIYDVQENYYLNIKSQGVYPNLMKDLLGSFVRLNEKLASYFIQQFLLAEKSYAQELTFLRDNYIILENKFKPESLEEPINYISKGVQVNPAPIKLLYSGTISKLYGIFEAIELANALFKVNNAVSLTIIGYCPQPEVYQQVITQIKNKPYITLIGGKTLVPHAQITEAIRNNTLGLLPYHSHPSISHCIPTKLYEYMANGLPVIVEQNPYWQPIIDHYQAGIHINYQAYKQEEILEELYKQVFYKGRDLREAFWETEEKKLLNWFQKVL
ncbi:glycosyltransferase [Adhaeribacter aquaticus]|uniref:glycosyltransferase n=1 Tax=Adhaeribacter aquaticus TaxID=299567 RepID=UPI0004156C7F|nr:glycosyltransferase [Adhaeribacter aquaticus]